MLVNVYLVIFQYPFGASDNTISPFPLIDHRDFKKTVAVFIGLYEGFQILYAGFLCCCRVKIFFVFVNVKRNILCLEIILIGAVIAPFQDRESGRRVPVTGITTGAVKQVYFYAAVACFEKFIKGIAQFVQKFQENIFVVRKSFVGRAGFIIYIQGKAFQFIVFEIKIRFSYLPFLKIKRAGGTVRRVMERIFPGAVPAVQFTGTVIFLEILT